MFVSNKCEHTDRETVTGAMGGGVQSYVKMLIPNNLSELTKLGVGVQEMYIAALPTCVTCIHKYII